MGRSVAVVSVVALLLFGLVAAKEAGASSRGAARSAGVVSASGALDCTASKGVLTVDPGLSFTGTATSAAFVFTGKLTCVGTSGVKGGTFRATGTSDSNNCGTLANQGIPAITATINWKGKFEPSTMVFSNGGFSIGNKVGIDLPSTGPSPPAGSTTVTGSFAYEPVAANFIADQSITAFVQGCYSTTGLTGFTFNGIGGTSTLNIAEQPSPPPPPSPTAPPPATVGVDASSPGAAVNEALVGVNHIPAGAESAMAAIGTTWARTDVSFEVNQGYSDAAYDCTTGVWNPSYLDGNVAIDRAAGAQVQLLVDYFPSCIDYQTPGLSSQTVSSRETAYKALVYQMALHEIGTEGVTTFEVWNEPESQMTLKQFLTLYRITAQQLEKAAKVLGRSIEVGGPGYDYLGQIDNTWISPLISFVAIHRLPLDFVDWHVYPNDPDQGPQGIIPFGICDTGAPLNGQPCWYSPELDVSIFKRGAEAVQSQLALYSAKDPALRNTVMWVDEWGIDSGNDARLSGPYGAALVAASLDNAQQGGVGRMSFFDAADDPANPTYSNFGLLTSTFTPKPAYYAMDLWHRLSGSLLPVTLNPNQPDTAGTPQIGAVGSIAADGTVNVMVYNFDPYDPSGAYGSSDPTQFDDQVSVNLSGLSAGAYIGSRSLIDGQDENAAVGSSTVTGPSTSLTFTLAGEGVTLITLTPTA